MPVTDLPVMLRICTICGYCACYGSGGCIDCIACFHYARGKKDGIAAGLKTLDAELAAAHKQMQEEIACRERALSSWRDLSDLQRAQNRELRGRLKEASLVPICKPPWESWPPDPEANRVLAIIGFAVVGLVAVVVGIVCGIAAMLSHISVTWV